MLWVILQFSIFGNFYVQYCYLIYQLIIYSIFQYFLTKVNFLFYLKIESTSFTPLWISNWIGLCIIHRFDIYYINESCFVWWCRFLCGCCYICTKTKFVTGLTIHFWHEWYFLFIVKCSLTGENVYEIFHKNINNSDFVFILCYNWLFSSVRSKCILATKWTATCDKLCIYQSPR